jgi:hypothetical protein
MARDAVVGKVGGALRDIVIASEAKQSMTPRSEIGLLRR